jgi:DNA-binding response OmpR family regulator
MVIETRPRVLIVDDEDSYRTPVANYLRQKGYLVDTAADAQQGLTMLHYADGQYDVVFVDQVLYGSEAAGLDLTQQIKQCFPTTPIVIVTGWMSVENGVMALRYGAYRYISKASGVQELELFIQISAAMRRHERLARAVGGERVGSSSPQANRILAVFANPKRTSPLRLAAEDRLIRESLRRSRERDLLHLDVLHAATAHDLRRALLDQSYRALHVSGHGTPSGLVFEDADGNDHVVVPRALADLICAHSPPLEVVVFNACWSEAQGQLLLAGVPNVIVNPQQLDDAVALEFTRGFYDALGAGKDVAFAYDEGCRSAALMAHGPVELPILLR